MEATPRLAGAAGAADAMNEIFGDFRKVVVDDVGDVLHVNSARGHVRGDEHAILPALKSGECRGSLRLRAVAVDHGRDDALAVQVFGDSLGAALGARENRGSARSP